MFRDCLPACVQLSEVENHMVMIDFNKRQITLKLVYYGPGLSGKTTNLEFVHKKAPEDRKGKLLSVAAGDDRTLFFDFMSLDLGKVGELNTKFQLYTVPGQVYYNATRKLVLMGVDGIAFVADSQPDKRDENKESYQNLKDNLKEYDMSVAEMPHVIQFNKRDLPDVVSVAELDAELNEFKVPTFEAVAARGEGVYETLKSLIKLVIADLKKKHEFLN